MTPQAQVDQPSDSYRLLHRLSSLAALVAGACYLGWRVLYTLGSASIWFGLAMFALEIWGYGLLAGMLYRAWPRSPRRAVPDPTIDADTTADVVITAGASDLGQIERSLICCDLLDGVGSVTVIEGRCRTDVAELCGQWGAHYRTDGGSTAADSLQVVLAERATGSVFWLEGGDVPLAAALRTALNHLAADQDSAIVQLGRQLQDVDSLVNLSRGGDPEYIQDCIYGPSQGAAGAAAWIGSGSLLRRVAFHSIGRWPAGDSAALDRAVVQLHRQGWNTVHDAAPLVGMAAPRSLGAYLGYRRRLALRAYRFVASSDSPLFARDVSFRQRAFHVAEVLPYTAGLRQMGMVALLVAVLLTGRLPLEVPVAIFAGWWLPYWILAIDARRLATRGLYGRGDVTRNAWRSAEAELSALRAAVVGTGRGLAAYRHRSSLGALRSPLTALVVLSLAILARAATFVDEGLLPKFSTTARIIVLGTAVASLIPLADVLQVTIRRKQRRSHHRVPMERPVRVGEHEGRSVDITAGGIAVVGVSAEVGSIQQVSLLLPMGSHSRYVTVEGVVRSQIETDEGPRIGVDFVGLEPVTRRALMDFCLNVAGRRHKGKPVAVLDRLTPNPPLRRFSTVLSLAAAVAGLSFMLVGPATASSATLVDGAICLADSDDRPLQGGEAQYQNGAWVTIGVTNDTGCVDGLIPQGPRASFRVTHEGRRTTQVENTFANTKVEFNTVPVIVVAVDGLGRGVSGVTVEFQSGGWQPFGTTDESGAVARELLGQPTEFRVTSPTETVHIEQDTAVDPDVLVVLGS